MALVAEASPVPEHVQGLDVAVPGRHGGAGGGVGLLKKTLSA